MEHTPQSHNTLLNLHFPKLLFGTQYVKQAKVIKENRTKYRENCNIYYKI